MQHTVALLVSRLVAPLAPRLALAAALVAATGAVAAAVAVPTPPAVAAEAHLLVDHHSGRILAESNADMRLEPASLTKMMTAYVVFAEIRAGHLTLEEEALVSEKAWRMEGSRMFIEVGTRVTIEALLKGLIIQSGNDASVALAEHVAGDETAFADLMNQYARRLGMTGSHFTNASGLPHEEHYTTARDMAIIASALVRDFPDLYGMHAIKEYVYNGITQYNRNKLLWSDDTVDGLKTGHTQSAGYCLVASAERDRMRLVSVVLGAESSKARERFTRALFDYGFRFYETHRVYGAREPVTDVRVWQGEAERLGMGLERDLWVTVPRGRYDDLDASLELDARIMAPVRAGTAHGTVRIRLGEESIAERPLIALGDVAEGGVWRQVSDYVWLLFE